MADNTTLNPGAGGDVIASDDISGVKFQRVKMTLGIDGVNNGDVSASNPMPVTTQSGLATEAKQDTGNTSLSSINTKLPAQGQAAMAASVPVVIASNQSAVPVTFSAPPVVGSYGAGQTFSGSASAQNLLSIENPSGSGRTVRVRRCLIVSSSTGAAVTATAFFRVARLTAIPTGTTVASSKRKSADASPVAIVRQNPSGTVASVYFHSAVAPGTTGTITVDAIVTAVDDAIELAPNEALWVDVAANDTDAVFSVSFYWQEI